MKRYKVIKANEIALGDGMLTTRLVHIYDEFTEEEVTPKRLKTLLDIGVIAEIEPPPPKPRFKKVSKKGEDS